MQHDTSSTHEYLGQDLEIRLLATLAAFVRERFFVDVGAEKGSFAAALFSFGMQGVMFEPMPRHRDALDALAAAHGAKAYAYAIDEKDGVRDFFVASGANGEELDYFHSLQRIDAEPRFRHSRRFPVQCRSIESLVAGGTLPPRVGILKTDTEGNDLRVLGGMGALRPELVVCEYFTEGLYTGWEEGRPELAIELLRSRGYSRYLATKRTGEFEYCTASPAGFIPRQWGNLFFLSDELYASAEYAIAQFLRRVETDLFAAMQSICEDRIAKQIEIANLERVCAERLAAINLLDAEVKRRS